MTINRWLDVVLFGMWALWCYVYVLFDGDTYALERFAPPFAALLLYLCSALLAVLLRDAILKLIATFWVIWPVIGTYFSIGKFLQRKYISIVDLTKPDLIFTGATLAVLLGLHVYLLIAGTPRPKPEGRRMGLFQAFPLWVFLLIYAAVLLGSGGTILTGSDITSSMYAVARGPIYAMRIVLVPTFALLALMLLRTEGKGRIVVLCYILFGLFISVLDGKRDLALMGVLAMLMVGFTDQKIAARGGRIILVLVLVLFSYGFLSKLRSDRDVTYGNWVEVATIAGVEYHDFAYSVTYLSAEYMETFDYDYAASALGALVNGKILGVFGLNKAELVAMDSARAWQRAFQADFGIRTGIVSEFYFAAPKYWALLLFGLGLMLGLVHRWFVQAGSDLSRIIAATALSVIALAMQSQSSATLGLVLSLVYLVVLLKLWQAFTGLTDRPVPAGAS